MRRAARGAQRGLTFFSLLVYGLLVAAGVFFVLQVVPSVTEHRAVKEALQKVADANPPTVAEARRLFDRHRDADMTIQTVAGSDLDVTKESGRVVVSVKWDKELHLVGPVSLLIRYEASSR